MRIIIAHNYTPHSFSVISWALANHLAQKGHEVLFFSHQPGFEKPIKPHANLEVVGWPEKRPTGWRSLFYFYKKHKAFKPQLVIAHFAPIFVIGLVSWFLRCPNRWIYYHTAEEANIEDTKPNKWVHKAKCLRKWLLYKAYHRVICVSKFAALDIQRYFGVSAKKLQVVYNALPDRFNGDFSKPILGPVRFHFLGRIDPCKRVLPMVEAFLLFLEKQPNAAELHIAGAGEQESALKEKISGRQGIFYNGAIPYSQVDDFIKQANFLVCPSLVETFGMVNAEALMNATPVLANPVGGIVELVIDGQTGMLSKGMTTANWVQVFTHACLLLKENPNDYLAMQQNCRKHYIEQLTIETYLLNMAELIDQL